MKKRIIGLILAVISIGCLVGCSNPFSGDDNNLEEIKAQVKAELEAENKKDEEEKKAQEEQEKKKQEEQEAKIREQVKKELEGQKSSDNNKNVTVNVNNDSKEEKVVVVKETIPTYVYYSNSYVFPESSSSYLSKSQVKSLSNYQLGIARNEIYARHGYIFKLKTFRDYFESQSWYVPRYSNESSIQLNSVEVYNVDLIKAEENRRGIQW